MALSGIDPNIFKEVARVFDPEDQIVQWETQGAALALTPGLESPGLRMSRATAAIRDLQVLTARSFTEFTPHGWGMSNIGVPAQQAALRALSESEDAANSVLADAIDQIWIGIPIKRMKYVYGNITDGSGIGTIGAARWRLIKNAQALHLVGNYDAAVPLILNAIEGLVADAQQGKLFFTGNDQRMIDAIEPTTLVGMTCSLRVLHGVYKEGVTETTTDCVLSRHGIMHGRVLGYGTKVASAKCWTLFDAVVEILRIKQQLRVAPGHE